ncbi:MAG TPA: PASTA domain-containing protein, partial [Acidimicrobiales bacterium]|nr:PASTA domain-containing protein [Acidimicrobiales bacterium]
HVGRVLGDRYRLVAPIGTGASAHVFLAEDVTPRRRVAVKVLHAALAHDESFLRRFRAEAQQAAALNHPNIMRVFDWGESDDGPFLVLEYLGGGSLRDLLDRDHLLSPSQALVVGLDAARALEYAHRRGLVHRDVKPANLLFDDEGRLCIADFGLARALAEAAWTEPSGAMLGTARYASPEQAEGSSVDGKSDVYALALVLTEAVTGQVPFMADTTIATLMARVGTPLNAPPELGPLAPVVERAGHPDHGERYDARQLVRALDKAAKDLPTPEPLPLVPQHVDDTAVLEPADDATELGVTSRVFDIEADDADGGVGLLPAARRRGRRWPKVALVVVLLLLGAVGAYAVYLARVPTHPVPVLAGKTVDEARAEVADEKFEVDVEGERFDENVPAGVIISQDPALGELREGRAIDVVVSMGAKPRPVPDLAGVDQPTAHQRLVDSGFVPKFDPDHHEQVPKGTVLSWTPRGEQAKGTEVVVTVSDGPAPREVPDVSGRTFEEAARLLSSRGLKATKAEAFSDTVEAGKVIGTRPAEGARAARDSTVTVVVSKGPDLVPVPTVVGRTVAEATAALQAAGLQVSGVFGPPRAERVILTDPQAGTSVKRGQAVSLYAR